MDLVIAAVCGLVTVAMGAAGTFWPRRLAHANDTRGPRWLREFSVLGRRRPAHPGRTSPAFLRVVGVVFLAFGLVLLVSVLLDLTGALTVR